MSRLPPAAALIPLAVLLAAAAAAALALGPSAIGLPEVLASLGLAGAPVEDFQRAAILEIRAPRVVLAVLIGAVLAQAGASLQGLLRNPLADPSLIGVSAGAALAAALTLTLLRPTTELALPVAAFAGGWCAALLALRLAQHEGYTRIGTLLLAGMAVNAAAGAGIGLASSLASDPALRDLVFWTFGSLGKAGWRELAWGAPLLLLVLVLMPRDARALNALLLGEAEAGHLGVRVESLKRRLLLLTVLGTATSVALAGLIGFVGLLVPHLVRLMTGPDHRVVLPASALLGALLLLLADIAARLWMAPVELPIGALTALVGGPFFLFLLLLRRDQIAEL